MKTCLICQKEEPSDRNSDPDVDIVCSDCIHTLLITPQEKRIEQYIEAVTKGQYGVSYALYTFVPQNIRKRYPLKTKRRR